MRKLDIGEFLIGGLLILVAVIFSPLWLPVYLLYYVSQKIIDFRFSRYVKANNGAKYFCYTARRNSLDFVKQNIIPHLPHDTNIIYITEKYQNLGSSSKFLGQIVLKMALMKKGFPCVAKFSDGQLIIESINHEVYQAILRDNDAKSILKKIHSFFADHLS